MNPTFRPRDGERGEPDGRADERDSASLVGATHEDWLSMQAGTDVCGECRRRRTPWEIRVCRGGCRE